MRKPTYLLLIFITAITTSVVEKTLGAHSVTSVAFSNPGTVCVALLISREPPEVLGTPFLISEYINAFKLVPSAVTDRDLR